MFTNKNWLILIVAAVAAMVMAACATPEPETIVETVVVEGEGGDTVVQTVVVTQEPSEDTGDEGDMAEGGEPSDVFVTGIFSEIATTNYWNYLGPGSDVWTGYVVSDQYPSMYTLSLPRFDFVPSLASDLPTERAEEGDFFVVEATLLEGLTWSDGEALTAEDVVFTINTAVDLNLGGNWAGVVPSALDRVEAVDDLTVKYYFTSNPGLAEFEYAVAQAPVLAEHFWAPVADEAASALAEAGEEPEALGDDATEDEQAAYDEELAAYQEAQSEARNILYEADATDEPVFGPYKVGEYEPGAFAEKAAIEGYSFSGLATRLYDNGAYEAELPDGGTFVAYGDAEGDALEIVTGPYVEEVVYSIYGSQDAAFLALQDGEIDYVFSPLGLSQGLLNSVTGAAGLDVTENASNGFRYLAFNTRKAPMSDTAFRQAVSTVIDQPFITDTILGGAALPAFSVVPEGNGFWYNPDVTRWGFDDEGNSLGRAERLESAVQILADAGYTWEDGEQPVFNADTNTVERGGTLIQPDGTPVEEITMLAPNAGYDPLRATAAIWVEEFSNDLGIPVTANLQPFQTIIPAVFAEGEAAADWDWYILGWGLGIYPDHVDSFFTCENDSASGGFNTPGFCNEEYDALVADFLAATDLEEARDLNYQTQEFIATEAPYVVLFTVPIYDVYRTNVEFPFEEVLDGIQGYNGLIGTVEVFQ